MTRVVTEAVGLLQVQSEPGQQNLSQNNQKSQVWRRSLPSNTYETEAESHFRGTLSYIERSFPPSLPSSLSSGKVAKACLRLSYPSSASCVLRKSGFPLSPYTHPLGTYPQGLGLMSPAAIPESQE